MNSDELRMRPDRGVADLVTGLRTLDWAWRPDEVDGVIRLFGWEASIGARATT